MNASPAGSPLIVFEDDHVLVVNKPAGLNTHAPAPFSSEGLYEWLRHREPRWADLAIIHRLDKDTSGLLVFGKTTVANRSLTEQFTQRTIRKTYVLITDQPVETAEVSVVSTLYRSGDRYLSRPWKPGAERAETRFRKIGEKNSHTVLEAVPVSGRTHQIRVHAASLGWPIVGDVLYGGSAAIRVMLHARELIFANPARGDLQHLIAEPDFETNPRLALRRALIDPAETNAFRCIHGAADGWPNWYVDQLEMHLLSMGERPLTPAQLAHLKTLDACKTIYHKTLDLQVGRNPSSGANPELVTEVEAPEPFLIRENGLRFELSLRAGYSVGLFLDQRDNRRRFLMNHVGREFPLFPADSRQPEVLNVFAYTCGFSVCAAKAGARVTSVDLSRNYLEWGRRNFALNGLSFEAHDFIYGDAFEWLKRLKKNGKKFEAIILDPPTFSRSKQHGVFRAEHDYEVLVSASLPLLQPGGVLLAATNAARLKPEDFLDSISRAVQAAQRRITQQLFVPQPPDFPITRDEPAYLKTGWFRVE